MLKRKADDNIATKLLVTTNTVPHKPRVRATNRHPAKKKNDKPEGQVAADRAAFEAKETALRSAILRVEALVEEEVAVLVVNHKGTAASYKAALLGTVKTVQKRSRNPWNLFKSYEVKRLRSLREEGRDLTEPDSDDAEAGSESENEDVATSSCSDTEDEEKRETKKKKEQEMLDGGPVTLIGALRGIERRWRRKTPKQRITWMDNYLAHNPESDAIKAKDMRMKSSKARAGAFRSSTAMIGNLMTEMNIEQGAVGFCIVVRSDADVNVQPYIYSSSPKVFPYVAEAASGGFNHVDIATKLEAYAMAGMEAINLNGASKQANIQALKQYIQRAINEGLAEIVGEKITMQYKHYIIRIVHEYKVMLTGWPTNGPVFGNPSHMSSYYPALVSLQEALKSGVCHWERITERKRKEVVRDYIKSGGSIENGKRAERSDKGKKRETKAESRDLNDAESSDSDNDVAATVAKIIAEGGLEDGDDAREGMGPAKKKRRIGGGKERPVNPAEQEGMLAMETGDEVPSDGTIVGKAKKRGAIKKGQMNTSRKAGVNAERGGAGLAREPTDMETVANIPDIGPLDPALFTMQTEPGPSTQPLVPLPTALTDPSSSETTFLSPNLLPGPASGIQPVLPKAPAVDWAKEKLRNPGVGYAYVPLDEVPVPASMVIEDGGRGRRARKPTSRAAGWMQGE